MKTRLSFFILIFSIGVLFSACKSGKTTFFVQNTHQYWDTVQIYIVSTSENRFYSDSLVIKQGDSLLWKENIIRDDKQSYFAKTLDFSVKESTEDKMIYTYIIYKNQIVSSGGFGLKSGSTKYEIITIKNNGGAFDIKNFGTDDKPEYKEWNIIADKETSDFLGLK